MVSALIYLLPLSVFIESAIPKLKSNSSKHESESQIYDDLYEDYPFADLDFNATGSGSGPSGGLHWTHLLHSPYLTGSTKHHTKKQPPRGKTCQPITVEFCRDLWYNQTKLPNSFGHRTQLEAAEEVSPLPPDNIHL
ncbi:hypothetical protein Ciccas_001345 [Cichlidogyrus casuarinus]|uniref:Uncharacterized protein n=1 Tax=Cichlidogyrus casuarinus TaxID=1844966 RepID=A0ABD2QKS4_9PLAT